MNGDVTARALEILENDMLITSKYATTEAVLDFLEKDPCFKTFSQILKENIIAAGLCSPEDTDDKFAHTLYTRINELEFSVHEPKPIRDITVKRWMKSRTNHAEKYETLVKICFALEMDLKTANSFLNKCGYNNYNIRNPKEAVYIYCIINKRPWSAAKKIYEEFKSLRDGVSKKYISDKNNNEKINGDDTTNKMESDILKGSSWQTDEDFLHTFLLPRATAFCSYSKTAISEYDKIKNPFYITSIKKHLVYEDSSHRVENKLKNDYNRKLHKRRYGENLPVSFDRFDTKITSNMKNVLEKYSDANAFFNKMSKEYVVDIVTYSDGLIAIKNNMPDICDRIGVYMRENRFDVRIQHELSHILSEVISADDVFSNMLPAVIGDNGRKRRFSTSDLHESVLYKFPHRQNMSAYEKNPASAGNGVYIRKALILMYYFAFAYEYCAEKRGETFFSDMLRECEFSSFIEEVNAVLGRCRFAPLYPANSFDWLILRSVRQFEICDYHEELDKCISFFDDVLAASFHKKDE